MLWGGNASNRCEAQHRTPRWTGGIRRMSTACISLLQPPLPPRTTSVASTMADFCRERCTVLCWDKRQELHLSSKHGPSVREVCVDEDVSAAV